MNVIDKIVVKDGVNADVTIELGYFTNQVSDINSALSGLSASRGVVSYAISGGKPTFSFEPFGNNELWVYVDGLGTKANGVTNSKQPSPYYFAPTSDGNQIVTIPTDSGTARHIIIKQYRGGTDAAMELKINMATFPENEVFKITNASSYPFGGDESPTISVNILQIPDETNYKFIGFAGNTDDIGIWYKGATNTSENVGSVELMRVGDNIYIL